MLGADQVLYFANDNSLPFERAVIEERKISEVPLAAVVADPIGAARSVVEGWGARFDQLLVHVDLDVLNGDDMPLAENCRTRGLLFEQLVAALKVLVAAPNWVGLTVAELNPDHGQEDGSTLRRFNESLADILACSPGLKL
jgi:arginase